MRLPHSSGSNKRDSASSVGPASDQVQRKSAKNSLASSGSSQHPTQESTQANINNNQHQQEQLNARVGHEQRQWQASGETATLNAKQSSRSSSPVAVILGGQTTSKQVSNFSRNTNHEPCRATNKLVDDATNQLDGLIDRDDGNTSRDILPSGCSELDQNDYSRRQSHCEIEKRRRDKMNYYIVLLSSLVHNGGINNNNNDNNNNGSKRNNTSGANKIDKLTVLRMAVSHVRSLRSSLCSFSSFHLRPSFLSSGNLLKNLILQMASHEAPNNLLMVVTCDRGKVLFVSQSSQEILNQDKDELVGQCLFDLIHKDDVPKVKEQITYFEPVPREMNLDSKTMRIVRDQAGSSGGRGGGSSGGGTSASHSTFGQPDSSTPQPGARRSFFCRIKTGHAPTTSSPSGGKPDGPSDVAATGQASGRATTKSASAAPRNAPPPPACRQVSVDKQQSALESVSDPTGSSSDKDPNRSSQLTKLAHECGEQQNSGQTSELDAMDDTLEAATVIATLAKFATPTKQPSSSPERFSSPNSDQVTGARGNSSLPSQIEAARMTRRLASSSKTRNWRYLVMHCTGYLKTIQVADDELDDEFDQDDYNGESGTASSCDEDETCGDAGSQAGFVSYNQQKQQRARNSGLQRTITCLVAVCRRSPVDWSDRPLTFTCRYSMEGKFVFVDQSTTIALGYTPQQLLGTSHYAYCQRDSVNTFKDCHRQSIMNSESVSSDVYQFKRANGQTLWLQTSLKCFRNPWTKLIDYIVANHTTAEGCERKYKDGCVPTKFNQDMTYCASGGVGVGVDSGSQSSSPASSSGVSLDSKKSSSTSISSNGSSYSMESYTSGGSIRGLLNHIDGVKSGGVRHAPKFGSSCCDSTISGASSGSDTNTKHHRGDNSVRNHHHHHHHHHNHQTRASSSSSRQMSNDDSGVYSDQQSCSSSLSQRSGSSKEYRQTQIKAIKQLVAQGQQSDAKLNDTLVPLVAIKTGENKTSKQLAESCQDFCSQSTNIVDQNIVNREQQQVPKYDSTSRLGLAEQPKMVVPPPLLRPLQHKMASAIQYQDSQHHHQQQLEQQKQFQGQQQQQQHYRYDQHHTDELAMSQAPLQWSNQPEQVSGPNTTATYVAPITGHPTIQSQRAGGKVMNGYVEPASINVSLGASGVAMQQVQVGSYEMMAPMGQYIADDSQTYGNQQQHNQNQQQDQDMQARLEMQSIRQQVQQVSQMPVMPMVWNTTPGDPSYGLHSSQQQEQQQQQQSYQPQPQQQQQQQQQPQISNCADLNSMAVEDDLDEDQLLEYLAICDNDSQLYNMQNGAYPHYSNMYR